MMKRLPRAIAACAAALALAACSSSGVPVTDGAPTVTLPPADVGYVAPIGDAALEYKANATLYLPRHDGQRLTAVVSEISFSFARPSAESLARALVNYPGDGTASSLGGDVKLSLYGANPVEVTRDVATVNLSATALQLDRRALYIAGQAIANTLCELPEIHYVNLLVMGKSVGLDIAGALPMGSFSRDVGGDAGAAYEQLLSRRADASEDPASKPLSANVTLYFPVAGACGFMGEARACSFPSQRAQDMATALLRELAEGSQQGIQTPALPLLAELLASPITLRDSAEAGGAVAELRFSYNYDEMLEAYGLTRAQSLASLCYTLCTFLPNVAGIDVTIGETPVTTLMLTDDFESSVDFAGGVERRADYAPLLYDDCTLYLSDGRGLAATRRPIPYYQRQNPRYLLAELAKGPLACDSQGGLEAVMPAGAIADADVLGLAMTDGTMLVNLAPSFEALGKGLDARGERMLAYSIVNTLCEDERVQRVCFFLSGSQWDAFGGEIYWRGVFTPMSDQPAR